MLSKHLVNEWLKTWWWLQAKGWKAFPRKNLWKRKSRRPRKTQGVEPQRGKDLGVLPEAKTENLTFVSCPLMFSLAVSSSLSWKGL